MSNRFESFRPLRTHDIFGEQFGPDYGISPEDAGREDAREAMAAAIELLRGPLNPKKLPKHDWQVGAEGMIKSE